MGGILSWVVGPLGAVVLAQVDDFQDGTTQSWRIGTFDPEFAPVNLADEGPGGVGDHALFYTSTGRGAEGSRMVVFSRIPDQWSGDYLAAGINGIQMDVANRGSAPLILRVGFNVLFGEAGSWFVSSDPVEIGPGTDWMTVSFPIGEGELTRVSGSDDYETVMSSVRSMRILSSANPSFRGDELATTIGIDNITAVPEPSGALLLGLGASLVGVRRRR